jgi:tetratricopeptide (TPR) repeat protein
MHSEMLGNQYFIARKYASAAISLREALLDNPNNNVAKKKLILCYTQLGEIRTALHLFKELIEDDIDLIINTDIEEDYCPCPELIQKYGGVLPYENNSTDLKIMLAILWLYCDAPKSLRFFKTVLEQEPDNKQIKSITSIIEERIKSKDKHPN